jgi:hypothetical protein
MTSARLVRRICFPVSDEVERKFVMFAEGDRPVALRDHASIGLTRSRRAFW